MSLFFIGQAATVDATGTKIELDGAAITSPDTHRTHQSALSDGDLIDGNSYVWTVVRDSDGRAERVVGTYNNDTTDYTTFVIYGFYLDFQNVIPNSAFEECNLEIQELA